jgi:hypothetical protein
MPDVRHRNVQNTWWEGPGDDAPRRSSRPATGQTRPDHLVR